MTQIEAPEPEASRPVLHVHVDQLPTPKRTLRQRLGAVAIGVISFVLGAFAQPAASWAFDAIGEKVNPPAQCKTGISPLAGDPGVRSGLVVVMRPSTNIGCFTTGPVDLVDGQDFSGYVYWRNPSAEQQDDVTLSMTLPDGVSLVPGTTVVVNSKAPSGGALGDDFASTGYNFGSYSGHANFWVQFDLHFDEPASSGCGENRFAVFAHRLQSNARGAQLSEAGVLRHVKAC